MHNQQLLFLNAAGDSMTLDVEIEVNGKTVIYISIALPDGRKAKPRANKNSGQVFFVYKGASWYLHGTATN